MLAGWVKADDPGQIFLKVHTVDIEAGCLDGSNESARDREKKATSLI